MNACDSDDWPIMVDIDTAKPTVRNLQSSLWLWRVHNGITVNGELKSAIYNKHKNESSKLSTRTTDKEKPIKKTSAYSPSCEKSLSTTTKSHPTIEHFGRYLLFPIPVDLRACILPFDGNLIQ